MGHALPPSLSPAPEQSPAPGVLTAGKVPLVSIGRLPVTNRDLYGREAELAWLDRCWAEGVHVATIVAWGGVGKSALVNTWLARLRDKGWPGAERVFGWSFYSQGTDRLSSSDEFIDAALRWFGDADPQAGSLWDKGERLAALVRRERALLILDGVEPLQWGPGAEQGKLKDPALQALVKELGAQNNGLCLITTRIEVADLEALIGDRVQTRELEHLSAEAGAELLKARGAKGVEEELKTAAKEYDGHCLALTLLGGYVRKRHRGDIRQRLHIPLLEGKPAQRMMGIYVRWFAGKPEIAVLRLLALFDRPAAASEIAALRAQPLVSGLTMFLKGLRAGAWSEAVTTLRDVGLLAPDSAADERLDAHPLVREYFAELLGREHPIAWREGHRRLYEHLKHTAKDLPDTVEEIVPLYGAMTHGCLAGRHQEVLDEIYWRRIMRHGKMFSSHNLCCFGLEVAALSGFFDPPWERLVPRLKHHDEGTVMSSAGFALWELGRLTEAEQVMSMSQDMAVAAEDWENAAIAAASLSEVRLDRGELAEALPQAQLSVNLAIKGNSAFRHRMNASLVAALLLAMGRRAEAMSRFENAERMQSESQPTHPLLYGLRGFMYCDMLLDCRRDADVRTRAARTLAWAETRGEIVAIAADHLSLGRAYFLAVQRDEVADITLVRDHIKQAVDGFRRVPRYLPLGLFARAALHIYTRAFDLARKDLTEALALSERSGFRLHETDAHLGHARLALAEGTPAAALPHLARARALITATGYHRRDEELAALEAACR